MAAWAVLYTEALNAWEATEPRDSDEVFAVLSWLLEVVDHGPPDDSLPLPLGEDLYLSRVRGTDIFVTFLALVYERRVVVRLIG